MKKHTNARLGGYTLVIKKQSEAEKNLQTRVFISHARDSTDETRALEEAMKREGLDPIWDGRERGRTVEGKFKKRIKEMLRCRAAVIHICPEAFASSWVEYELGFLEGRGTPILLWDPESLLSSTAVGGGAGLAERPKNVHLFRHMPAISDPRRLIEQLKAHRMYADLYRTEFPASLGFPEHEFERRFTKHTETVTVKLQSALLRGKDDLFRGARLGTLLVNFGFFPKPDEPPIGSCPILREGTDSPACRYAQERPCARYGIRRPLTAENAECMLLNHVEWSGRFVEGDEEHSEPALFFYVPVHKTYGTTFKAVIDPPDAAAQRELIALLTEMGLSPTVSDSRNSLRIYLSVAEMSPSALFCLGGLHYGNNFFCPRALAIAGR